MEIDPPVRPVRRVDYLSLLAHISKLGTKQFAGSSDPIEADEWRSRLARNFSSTRCPEEYKKDIAVHFLEGDAHNWWLALDKRTNGTIERFSDFEVEFNHKYFPSEAWDRLESHFLDLSQGRMTVREYEEKFNRLRRYVGKELEEETVQIRRFVRGLRVELRTYSSVGHFQTVSELVERMAMVETNLAEEAKQRRHGGECWKAMGACTRCGKMDHAARDCPGPKQGRRQGSSGGDTRGCHHCGKEGHFKRECPKLQAEQDKGRGEESNQSRGQTSNPRVYELSKDEDETKPFKSITGLIGKGLFQIGTRDDPCIVYAAGGQAMHSLGLVRDVPVMIQDRVMPVDLVVVPLKNHEVILGMDWLGKNRATLDCHQGRVQFQSGCGPPRRFQGIKPASSS
ncbi:uncharacterized protein LOC125601076 [Brassica napus]|uniref:uncharacterized protein LOC125601076 n=1 Tax=Brassica napus TaxID=3708 RepID=UPI0020791EB5|nr:uncharacterized protein LOC125601076 [Brassica napus]